MKIFHSFLAFALLSCVFTFSEPKGASLPSQIKLVASTPCDDDLKRILKIPIETKIDFIRWELAINETEKTFLLNLQYGESQPNTLGFAKGGQNQAFQGNCVISKSQERYQNSEIYQLVNQQQGFSCSMVKLNDNIFHLLNSDHQLMVGNGGWSCTLNRKEPQANASTSVPVLTTSAHILENKDLQAIFDGRTPCQDFAAHYDWPVGNSCFKLKWKLILNKDAKTVEPTTYTLRKVVNGRAQDVTGRWAIKKGIAANPEVVIYQLDPDQPDKTISLWAGDENVLFFLDTNNQLFTGNADFSFTLNKRKN